MGRFLVSRTEFEDCCGAMILSNLPFSQSLIPWTQKEFSQSINRSECYIQFAILNEDQMWQLKYWKKEKFKVISNSFKNPSTGQKLCVLIYTPPQKRLKKPKKRLFSR